MCYHQLLHNIELNVKNLMLVLRCKTFLGTFVGEQLLTHQKLLYNFLKHGVMWYCNDLIFNEFLTNYTCVFLSVLCAF
jgi:hypothetical protein